MANTRRRTTAVLVLVTLTWVFALSVQAQEEGDATTTTVAGSETTVADTGLVPAVPIEQEEEAPATPDWTYRYLIPTALVLAVLIVLVTSIRYFSDVVRKRYRVIEE